MFDFAYGFNHNLEIDFDLNIVADIALTLFIRGLKHPCIRHVMLLVCGRLRELWHPLELHPQLEELGLHGP